MYCAMRLTAVVPASAISVVESVYECRAEAMIAVPATAATASGRMLRAGIRVIRARESAARCRDQPSQPITPSTRYTTCSPRDRKSVV